MPQNDQRAGRIRAARAYAGISQPDMAAALDISPATLRRIEDGERPATKPELLAIADATDVPIEFLRDGFGAATKSDVEARIAHLEKLIEANDART